MLNSKVSVVGVLLIMGAFLLSCTGDEGPVGPMGPAGPAGLFAHLSVTDPFCEKLAEEFKKPIEKEKADNGLTATVEHAASSQAL